jgi:hypothetical protein
MSIPPVCLTELQEIRCSEHRLARGKRSDASTLVTMPWCFMVISFFLPIIGDIPAFLFRP